MITLFISIQGKQLEISKLLPDIKPTLFNKAKFPTYPVTSRVIVDLRMSAEFHQH